MKAKKYMIIGIFILMIALVGSVGTYAWFTWKSTSNTSLTMSIGKLADVTFTSGNDISTSTLSPVYNYTDGEVTTFSINNKDTTGTTVNYAVKLNITSIATELKSTSLKYVLLKNNTIVQEGDFSTISTGSTTIYSDSISTSGITNYKFYLYIDGNIENNTSMINKTLSGTLTVTEITDTYELTNGDGTTYTPSYNGSGTKIVRSNAPLNKFKEVRVDNAVVDSSNYTLTEGSTIITFKESYLKTLSEGEHILKIISTDGFTSGKIIIKKPVTVAQMITNLYTNAAKTTTTVNSVTYNLASSVGLMNDRKGSMSTGINAGNIRYYGASPNNYIYFNCSDYSNQTSSTCETWRIIGVVDGKVKLIRNETIGQIKWNKNSSNDWSTATLNTFINTSYLNSIDDSEYTKIQTSKIGINSVTRELISTETYSLKGFNTKVAYANQIYTSEKESGSVYNGNSESWTGKIAIPYASDYMYSADMNKCTSKINSYYNCRNYNWMDIIMATGSGSAMISGWLLTHRYDNAKIVYVAPKSNEAYLFNRSQYVDTNEYNAVPTIFLNNGIKIDTSTNGSEGNPYQLSLN